MTFNFPEKAARMTAPIVASKCIKMHVSSMKEKISQCFGCIYTERKQESVGVFSETWRWEWQLASQTGESRITSVGYVCKSAARMLVNLCRTKPRCSPETDTGSSSPEPFLRAAEGSSSTYPCPLPRWAVTEKRHATYEGLKYSSPKNEHLLILRPSNQSWGHPQAISFFLQ